MQPPSLRQLLSARRRITGAGVVFNVSLARVLTRVLTSPCRKSRQLVEHVLDMDALPDLVVNASYSPELAELKEQMDEIKEEVEELHREARDGWCDFGDKVRLLGLRLGLVHPP